MSKGGEEFRILITRSKNLAETLREENKEITPMQRAQLVFELRLAYNLALNQCHDRELARELLQVIGECEELLSS